MHICRGGWVCLFLIAFLNPSAVVAQRQITGISALWDDAFHEWEIYAVDHNNELTTGSLRVKWPLKGDWREWILDLGHTRANIRMKYQMDNHHWELRTSDNRIVDFKSKWRNDPTQWRILYGGEQYDWSSPYRNDLNYWYYEGEDDKGFVEMFTVYENDMRDWEFVDNSSTLPEPVKLAMLFITTFYTTPK